MPELPYLSVNLFLLDSYFNSYCTYCIYSIRCCPQINVFQCSKLNQTRSHPLRNATQFSITLIEVTPTTRAHGTCNLCAGSSVKAYTLLRCLEESGVTRSPSSYELHVEYAENESNRAVARKFQVDVLTKILRNSHCPPINTSLRLPPEKVNAMAFNAINTVSCLSQVLFNKELDIGFTWLFHDTQLYYTFCIIFELYYD